jgi:hypothetical protein
VANLVEEAGRAKSLALTEAEGHLLLQALSERGMRDGEGCSVGNEGIEGECPPQTEPTCSYCSADEKLKAFLGLDYNDNRYVS